MALARETNGRLVTCSLVLGAGFFLLAYLAVSVSTYTASRSAETVMEFQTLEMRNGILFAGLASLVLAGLAFTVLRWFRQQEQRNARLDEQLKSAESRLATSTLVHTVIHDTNNLLGVVRSGLTMLKDPDLPVDRALLCDRIGTAVDRIEELHRQLLHRERAMHDREAQLEEVPVDEIFEELRAYARLHPRLKDCRLDFLGGADLCIRANRTEFAQAVLNLMLNAADATGNRGRVMAEAAEFHGQVRVQVEDDGPGVPAEERERIFKAFYTKKQHGMGLGLMSVKGFCEHAGGRVAIDSSRWGGARFVMDLPLCRRAAPVPVSVAEAVLS